MNTFTCVPLQSKLPTHPSSFVHLALNLGLPLFNSHHQSLDTHLRVGGYTSQSISKHLDIGVLDIQVLESDTQVDVLRGRFVVILNFQLFYKHVSMKV